MPNRIIKESIRTSRSVNALNDFEFRVWLYLITYVDDYGRGSADPELLKGFVFPRRKAVTEQQIKRALDNLAITGMINLYDVDGESFFCFPNWSKHQRIQTKKSKFPEPDDAELQKSTVSHRESPPESESNPNPESESKSEENTAGAQALPATSPSESKFDLFWQAYPKKVGKEAARKAFSRVKAPLESLLTAIERQKCGNQWLTENGRFIPNPATWLNQGRWEDDVTSAAPTAKPGYGVQGHHDPLNPLEEAAVNRLFEKPPKGAEKMRHGVQNHGDDLTAFQMAAVERMLAENKEDET